MVLSRVCGCDYCGGTDGAPWLLVVRAQVCVVNSLSSLCGPARGRRSCRRGVGRGGSSTARCDGADLSEHCSPLVATVRVLLAHIRRLWHRGEKPWAIPSRVSGWGHFCDSSSVDQCPSPSESGLFFGFWRALWMWAVLSVNLILRGSTNTHYGTCTDMISLTLHG